jgi:protein TonB
MVVVSDKGFACSVQLLRGIDKETDADALAAVTNWTFKPATKDGRPVPVVVTVEMNYVMKDGKLVRAPYHAPSAQQ